MKRWIERALNIHPGDLGRGTLLCSCLFVIIGSYVTGKLWRRSRNPLSGVRVAISSRSPAWIQLVASSPYSRAIAAVICTSSFATTLTGWQFKAVAKQSLVNKDTLAIFFGDFYFYVAVFALILQSPRRPRPLDERPSGSLSDRFSTSAISGRQRGPASPYLVREYI